MTGIFSLFGPPEEIVSDNGPQFVGKPFQDMCKKSSYRRHITSSPHYPRSNGLAERMVRTIKNLLTKYSQTSQDSQLAMMHLRATPVDNNLRSPAEMLFGRPIRTTLPSHYLPRDSAATEFLLNRQDKMKEVHDRHASSDLPPLHVGQPVRVLHPRDNTWIPAKVSKVSEEPRSYEVSTPNGGILKRNRSHLREVLSRFDEDHTTETQPEEDNVKRPTLTLINLNRHTHKLRDLDALFANQRDSCLNIMNTLNSQTKTRKRRKKNNTEDISVV
nr:uncharacterized protein K02A2.6-like [Lytechinus pictus]